MGRLSFFVNMNIDVISLIIKSGEKPAQYPELIVA